MSDRMDTTLPALAGCRILVVEDEMMIAMLIEDILGDHGCRIVGPASRVAVALRLLAEEAVDIALLDVNLNGEDSYPIADELARRGIPYVFATGYGAGSVRLGYAPCAVLQKPFDPAELCACLADVAAKHVDSAGTRV
ncbi:MAG: hypothetical protein CTY25_14710 [Methylobacterium sp.]|nr:MAG: hypothetical protein CTY25_14710 [Methylobacterium sp.]